MRSRESPGKQNIVVNYSAIAVKRASSMYTTTISITMSPYLETRNSPSFVKTWIPLIWFFMASKINDFIYTDINTHIHVYINECGYARYVYVFVSYLHFFCRALFLPQNLVKVILECEMITLSTSVCPGYGFKCANLNFCYLKLSPFFSQQ
jgi:hypothetical protein